ncbi:MAG: hypothetical protein ABR567_10780 [Myxococcales bacterium]|nr:hypothetical protein [Myxococcales bacterium]
MPSALSLCVWLLAAAGPAGDLPSEPGLAETADAASRVAAGSFADDLSRTTRARRSHWAPQLRGQALVRDDEKSRNGEFRLAPVREEDLATGHAWSVALTWDFSQLVYAREESQLALAHVQLARARREAAGKAAQLWIERHQQRARWLSLSAGALRAEACFAELRLTAELDSLTAGLFRDALSREEAACAVDSEEKR